MFLALNSVAGTTALGNSGEFNKYENMYNKMTKNLDTSKLNNSNYKLLEKILNQKNKELKELYLQGDYIVKPEYLEWQIFFSGFYNSKDRGGTKETNKIPVPSTSGILDVSIRMPEFSIKDKDIKIRGVSVAAPEVNVIKNNVTIPAVAYSNTVAIPDFSIPSLPEVNAVAPTIPVNSAALTSFSTATDRTFYTVPDVI